MTTTIDDYRRFNYEICTAIDLTKVAIVLDRMESYGMILPNENKAFMTMARGLSSSIRHANDRYFNQPPSSVV